MTAANELPLPVEYHDLLSGANTAILVSLLPDGSPQGSPVWFTFDGEAVRVSTAKDRQKHVNLLKDGRVAVTIVDPLKSLRYIEIRGFVTIDDDPSHVTRDAVARKHGFSDGAAFDKPGTERVTVTIHPTRIIQH